MLNLYSTHEMSEDNFFTAEEYVGISCPPHSHYSMEIIVVREGSFTVERNETRFPLQPRDAILIMPFELHKLMAEPASNVLILTVTPTYFEEYRAVFENRHPEHPVIALDDTDMAYLEHHFPRVRQNQAMEVKCFFYILLNSFVRGCKFVPAQMPSDLLRKVVLYTHQHHSQRITLKKLSAELHINYVYLSRVFNRHIPMGFSSFLNNFRLEHAIRLLKSTDLSASEICYECGWGSIRNFNRVFKAELSCTPTEFRGRSGEAREWTYFNIPNIVEREERSMRKLRPPDPSAQP